MQSSGVRCETAFGSLVLDTAEQTAAAGGRKIFLSAAEMAILSALMMWRDIPMTRESIVELLASNGISVLPRMVDVHICRLRYKLSTLDLGSLITTAWGRGYLIATTPGGDGIPLEPIRGHSIAALLTA